MIGEAALVSLQLRKEELFVNVEDIQETPETIKAYFLKLMPNIELGDKANQNIVIRCNKRVFANAPECAVADTIDSLRGQNYITLKPFDNERPNFRAKAKFDETKGEYIVPQHSQFIATVLNDNPNDMRFTAKM